MNAESKMNASDIPDECLQDPQFVKVLTASLCSQIAESKKVLADTDVEIQALKDKVEQGLERRKVLKQINRDLKQKQAVQETALESMKRDARKRSSEIEAAKHRLDDASLRQIADRAKFEKILDEYGVKWEQYKAAYEEFPLAKERERCRTAAQKLNIERMVAAYKRDEFVKMLKQRKVIDAMRIREAGVDISKMILQRWKDQQYFDYLQTVVKKLKLELEACEKELSELREEDEKATLAEIETSKMPPPRLDFSFIRSVYPTARNIGRKVQKTPRRNSAFRTLKRTVSSKEHINFAFEETFLLTLNARIYAGSVDTLMLEEMCKNPKDSEAPEHSGILSCVSQNSPEGKTLSTSMIEASDLVEPSVSEVSNDRIVSVSVAGSNIEDGLRKLGIDNSKTAQGSETPRYPDDNANVEGNNDYQDEMEESFRRTRRWCEESRNELDPYLLSGDKSKSAKESRQIQPNDDSVVRANRTVRKAFSSHGSEMKITNAPSDVTGSKWSFCIEKASEFATERASPRCNSTPGRQNVSRLGKRKHSESTSNPGAAPTTNNYEIYDEQDKFNDDAASRVSQKSNDNSEMTVDANSYRPKIISVEKTHYPLGELSRCASVVGTPSVANVGSPRNYPSSRVGSDNASNVVGSALLQETPHGSFINECGETPGYPLFTSSQNSSPQRDQSIISFSSTIVDHRLNNNDAVTSDPPKEKNPAPQQNLGGFFGNKRRERDMMF